MPTIGEFFAFLHGQIFQGTRLPITDLTGKTMIVTGANTGLGLECAKHLVRLGVSNLILACRNVKKGEAAKTAIEKEATKHSNHATIEVWEVDLEHYQSVLFFNERVRTQLPRLDGFVANAGVELLQFSRAEGLEKTLTVNVVSTLMMAIGVLPKLRETSIKHATSTALTVTGSCIHIFGADGQLEAPETVDVLDSLSNAETAVMEGSTRYMLSKLIVHQLMTELAPRVTSNADGGEVVVNWVNPGWCKTDLFRNKHDPLPVRLMLAAIGRTAEEGSRDIVLGVCSGADMHNCYITEGRVKQQSQYIRSARGERMRKRLWTELEERIKRISPETAALMFS